MITFLEGGAGIAGLASIVVLFLPLLVALLILVFELMQLANNPARYKKTLIRLGAVLVLFVICWAMAKSDAIMFDGKDITEKMGLSAKQVKLVGGFIGVMIISTLIAFLLLIGAMVRNVVTNK